MRIAILSTPAITSNGWGRYTRDLITALAALGHQIVFITSGDADIDSGLPVQEYHRILPSITAPRRFNSLRLLAMVPAVGRLVANCEVVHVIAEPYALAVPQGHKLIVTAHGTYLPRTARQRLVGFLYRRAYRRATIICVSRYTQQQVTSAVPGTKTIVIPNGVDFERYQKVGSPQTKTGPTILTVGQLKARKGFHILAQAMKAVRQTVSNAKAVFIGDSNDTGYRQRLEAQLAADGLSDAVHILGRVSEDELQGWYHAADVFALPAVNIGGHFEGFGLVYLEANAAGLPVIGTLGNGGEEAIRDGETGYLIPQNDVSATAGAIIRLLTNDELRSKMGTQGIAFARQHQWSVVASRVVEVYRS